MYQDELSGPDLADANAVGLPYVVIGGFSVIANGYLRATKDSSLLVLGGLEADDVIPRFLERSGATRLYDGKALVAEDASLRSIVGFKRLADHPRDCNDLEELKAFNGELPIDPIPGLDS